MLKSRLFKHAFVLLVVVAVLNLLAETLYLNWTLNGFDKILHLLSGTCVAMAVFLYFKFKPADRSKTKMILTTVLTVFLVGILWEIYELYFGITSLSDGIAYVTDTLSDMAMDIIGGFFGSLYSLRMLHE